MEHVICLSTDCASKNDETAVKIILDDNFRGLRGRDFSNDIKNFCCSNPAITYVDEPT